MVPGIDLSNRNTQIALGLGLTGVAAGAALLAKRSSTTIENDSHDHCCGCSSISSYEEEDPSSESIFSHAYKMVFGQKDIENTSAIDFSVLEAPIEIETEAVNITDSSKKTFIGSLGLLAKALILLPLVIVASIFKGIFTGISSFLSSLFGKGTNKASAL